MIAQTRDIFCINLDSRKDRLELFDKESKKAGFTYEKISGIIGGINGCTKSHLLVAKTAKERKLGEYIIFEDDAEFCDSFANLFIQAYHNLPLGWNVLMLGYNHISKPIDISHNIQKITRAYSNHAMVINSNFYDVIIDALENTPEPNDVVLANLQNRYDFYCTTTPLAWQRNGYSNIQKQNVNYDFLKQGSQMLKIFGKYE